MLSPSALEAKLILNDMASVPAQSGVRTIDKPLLLYGAGNMGVLAEEFLMAVEVPFEGFIDENASELKLTKSGSKIFAPNEITESDRSKFLVAVSVVYSSFDSILKKLKSLGYTDVVPFYDISQAFTQKHPLYNGWFIGKLEQEDVKKIEHVLMNLKDSVSRAHYLQFLFWRRLREERPFEDAPITTGDRFFIPEVMDALTDSESFVDCGAHHGEVIKTFISKVNGNYSSITAIEPDRLNLTVLADYLSDVKKAELISVALGAKEADVPFAHDYNYASKVTALGRGTVKQVTLDQLELNPTYLKIHVEGGELSLLKGAYNTLQSERPIVAVTFYHSEDGIWKIQNWLIENLRNYHHCLRLHAWCGTGGVFYCIPNERLSHE